MGPRTLLLLVFAWMSIDATDFTRAMVVGIAVEHVPHAYQNNSLSFYAALRVVELFCL